MTDKSSLLTLVGLNIEGLWNLPLLKNAAELSDAPLLFVHQEDEPSGHTAHTNRVASIEDLRGHFDHLLACETGRRSRSIYEYPTPRGRTALLVGNELAGISQADLRKADQVVSVPMRQSQMSSVNVGVAAAISLYTLRNDLARKGMKSSRIKQANVDVLLYGASDPSELGSLLRSVWAFGWRRAFLDDQAGVWFTKHRETILAGRAAARRERNPLVVLPIDRLVLADYDAVIACPIEPSGMPLSRFRLPRAERLLITFGVGARPDACSRMPTQTIAIDYANRAVTPLYRHAGSILLSYISTRLQSESRHG